MKTGLMYVCLIVVFIAVCHDSICTMGGCVLTLGQGDTGQLGLGPDVMERTKPGKVDIDAPVVQISAGGMHTVCLTDKGEVSVTVHRNGLIKLEIDAFNLLCMHQNLYIDSYRFLSMKYIQQFNDVFVSSSVSAGSLAGYVIMFSLGDNAWRTQKNWLLFLNWLTFFKC